MKHPEKSIYYILRIACAMCFIGHGSFGIITKAIWCNYFGVIGIDKALSYQLMPFVGGMDIAMGLVMLFYPVTAIPLWLVIWGFITASLRPLSGEHFAEWIERGGNYGAPFAFLMLTGGLPKSLRDLFRVRREPMAKAEYLPQIKWYLTIFGFLLLAGHGWLNLSEKQGLLAQYASLGFNHPGSVALFAGCFEVLAAFTLFFNPKKEWLLFLFIWKAASELFYPHYELFEWVERGGSYGVLLALWCYAASGISIKAASWKKNILSPVSNERGR